MAINVKLATSGVAGATEVIAGEITAALNNNTDLSPNSVNILTDGGTVGTVFTVRLPVAPIRSGTVVEFKNLLTEIDPVNNPGITREVTIGSNGHLIDGVATNITTETRLQVFRLVYVNTALGWLAV